MIFMYIIEFNNKFRKQTKLTLHKKSAAVTKNITVLTDKNNKYQLP